MDIGIREGIKGKTTITVTEGMTARAAGSGYLPVFATPMMIALIEHTAADSVQDKMEPGTGTVGTVVNVRHVSATPVGMDVTCETELVEVDRRRLVFSVQVRDAAGVVGEGTHERFIVDNEKFMERAEGKREKS